MNEFHRRILTGLLLAILTSFATLLAPTWVFNLLLTAVFLIVALHELPRFFSITDVRYWLLFSYPFCAFLMLMYMQMQGQEVINMLIFTLVGIYDAGSYLFGKYLGKHKINSTISPGKTWEGFFGGFILTSLVPPIFFNTTASWLYFQVPLSFLISITALAGDLFESFLKRNAGIKDSGSLLPGHGGILDRIDGVLMVTLLIFPIRSYLIPYLI